MLITKKPMAVFRGGIRMKKANLTEKDNRVKRVVSCAMAVLLCLSVVFAGVTEAMAASPLPPANDETRHTVCHTLSAQARSYYSGDHSYDALCALSGARDSTNSAAAMRNNALFDALHALMADTHTFYTTYSGYQEGSLAYYWAVTDSVAGSNTYVMFYSDLFPSGEVKLNREHIWPKSRASYAQEFGGADLHHLRPSAESVNMAKSDHMFGYVDGTYSDGIDEGEIGGNTLYWLMEPDDLFECKDDVKGDVARILLYVYCRWMQPNLYSDVAEKNLPPMDEDDSANNGKRVIESLDTLLLWCALDPVDTWEMEQNDRIQSIQGNRNVFIDYPDLAWKLFGRTAPNGMTTPTKAGCTHAWKETSRHETCAGDGAFTLSCSVCGDVYSRRLAPLAHTDADDNEYCDVCEQPLAVFADLKPVTALRDGMHFTAWNPASGLTIGREANEEHKLETSAAHPHGSVLHPRADTAVFTARQTTGGWYLICGGKYLASAKTGNRLYWNAEPNDYSIWNMEETGTDNLVCIVNLNAAYYGKQQALEYYNNVFTCFSKANTAAFRFRIYAVSDHVWSGPVETIAATCETAGIAQDACILCGKAEPIEVPALGHALQKTEAVQPTATSGGNIEYWTCTRCGAQFTDAEGTQKVEDPAALILPPDNSCPLCGRTHERSAFDKWIGRIHKVLYWIRSLFQKIFGINKSAVYAP